jgi:hypothetical protein
MTNNWTPPARTRVIDHSYGGPTSAPTRKVQPGPELRLVEWLLSEVEFPVVDGERITVFREVQLEAGIPDVVVVTWDPSILSQWNLERPRLGRRALRILHYIYVAGAIALDDLIELYGQPVVGELGRLMAAGMIMVESGVCSAQPTEASYAVRSIAAIEAKVSRWRLAYAQAMRNTWFASESYILLPALPTSRAFRRQPIPDAVGVITQQAGLPPAFGSNRTSQPTSYASWAFNEWIWQDWRHFSFGH